MYRTSPETLGIISNFDAPFMCDPATLLNSEIKEKAAQPGKEKTVALPPGAKTETAGHDKLFPQVPSKDILHGCTYTFEYKDKSRKVKFGKVLFRPHGILGRGTLVVEVTCCCNDDGCACAWKDLDLVMKLSFASNTRDPEVTFIQECMDIVARDPAHNWVLNHLPEVHATFSIPFGPGTVQGRLKEEFGDDYEERELHGSIQSRLYELMSLETSREFGQAIYDIVQCHEWVHEHARILHRDISLKNMMVRRASDGTKFGVLNDFDLALFVDRPKASPTSNHRTGTRPFMAHEQHDPDWKGPVLARHDLESFFYATLLLSCIYEKPGGKVVSSGAKTHYDTWLESGDDSLSSQKIRLLHKKHPWLRRIQWALRFGFVGREYFEVLSDEVDEDQMHELNKKLTFDDKTLNGKVTYDMMIMTMYTFNEVDLVTRSSKRQAFVDQFRLKWESQRKTRGF
ncbi:hypothetical protein BDP27DRAFT_1330190 [Rhodocollybia butyracea]|uniref:Protein kinase domain-containing protein n=1 Tax=Rhodocollybia butyracea TaxID=206335 RepID=A0A9P5U5G7_9AGAR|nr:hypothetical protein BDP27DRAFT_1330190 [Rhodocollybia butyracea]